MLSQTSHLSLALHKFRENPRLSLRKLSGRIVKAIKTTGIFLKTSYVDGFRALVEGRYNRRQAVMIIAGSLPTILGALMITLPGLLFPSPGHQAFYYFGSTLGCEPSSLIPVVLGTVSSTLGLRIPLG